MAKQKIPIVGIIIVVGLMVFIVAVSNGTFKNFAVQDTNSPTPTPTATPHSQSSGIVEWLQNVWNQIWNGFVKLLQAFGINIGTPP